MYKTYQIISILYISGLPTGMNGSTYCSNQFLLFAKEHFENSCQQRYNRKPCKQEFSYKFYSTLYLSKAYITQRKGRQRTTIMELLHRSVGRNFIMQRVIKKIYCIFYHLSIYQQMFPWFSGIFYLSSHLLPHHGFKKCGHHSIGLNDFCLLSNKIIS